MIIELDKIRYKVLLPKDEVYLKDILCQLIYGDIFLKDENDYNEYHLKSELVRKALIKLVQDV